MYVLSFFSDLSAIFLTDLMALMQPSERIPSTLHEVMFASFNAGSLTCWWFMSLVQPVAYFWLITRRLKFWSRWMISRVPSFIWSVSILAPCSFSDVPTALWKAWVLLDAIRHTGSHRYKFWSKFLDNTTFSKLCGFLQISRDLFFSEKKNLAISSQTSFFF